MDDHVTPMEVNTGASTSLMSLSNFKGCGQASVLLKGLDSFGSGIFLCKHCVQWKDNLPDFFSDSGR